MKLSSINLNMSSGGEALKKNLSMILWAFLFVVILSVSWIVYQEVRKVSLATEDNSGITGQIVRVNMTMHQELSQKLDNNERFVPRAISGDSVFSTAPNITQ